VPSPRPEAAEVVAGVVDPELPVVTLAELGIVRHVSCDGHAVVVEVTPTYSGCPAMDEIRLDIRRALGRAGFGPVEVRVVLQPPWTTDWITDDGRRKLAIAGIAPPRPAPAGGPVPVNFTPPGLSAGPSPVACPRCGGNETVERSRFGSTPCKALHHCRSCDEAFEYMKPL
jgi:ring-1,2-phenylacetyl-CoA epoxidase subunit PaaD